MGRGRGRERARLWAWVYLTLFGGAEGERDDDTGTPGDESAADGPTDTGRPEG